jgi:hypothetical protein
LTIDLPSPAKILGLACLPRQDMDNGRIKDYAVAVRDDGKNWKEVARGTFTRGAAQKTIEFNRPVETAHLKFIALSPFDARQPYASLAELTILVVPKAKAALRAAKMPDSVPGEEHN